MVLVEETQTLSVLIGSCRGGAGTHLVLVEETQTLSVLIGSCRGSVGTHLILAEGDADPFCSHWLL